jgi:hypothetical protein
MIHVYTHRIKKRIINKHKKSEIKIIIEKYS